MNDTAKPRVATVIVLGEARGPKFEGMVPVIWGQTRGFYAPNGALLKGSPGERSLFGEHVKDGRDADSLDAALNCAHMEFWYKGGLTRDDFRLLASDVDTEKSINDVFLLLRYATPLDMDIGEGDGLLRIPLDQLELYVTDCRLTEASCETLAAAGDIQALYDEVRSLPGA